MMIIALIFTMLIELAVLLLLRERRPLVLGSSFVINILTNVPLNLFVAHVDGDLVAIVLGELVVILVEALCYRLFIRDWSRAFIYSSLCNAVSFLTGLLAQLLIVLFHIHTL